MEKNKIVVAMKKIGLKALSKAILFALAGGLGTAIFLILEEFFFESSPNIKVIVFGPLLIFSFAILSGMNHIIFGVKTIIHAFYLEKHTMDCYIAGINEISRTIFSYLELGSWHLKDKATYEFKGKYHDTNIYKMLSEKNPVRTLTVFEDINNPSVIFAIPTVYIMEQK